MDFTYQKNINGTALETYEWDNVWIEHADKENISRVLYIGDSISCGTRREATAAADGEFFFDGFGTSKAVDNPYFCDALSLFAAQEGGRRAIVFNNGLHGWHLDDEVEYPLHYEKIVKFLMEEFSGTPIFLALSTSLRDKERNARCQKRNAAVLKIAEKYGLPTIDLYSVSAQNPDLLSGDGIHFTPDGYKALAQKIVDFIIKSI